MPDQPTVACILLTKDRPQMARRAVQCFREQTYERKRLVVWNTGEKLGPFETGPDLIVAETAKVQNIPRTIGALRNEANLVAHPKWAEIIAHWDDDDLSHPNRIAEQVALLEASCADVVGYREMLFWRTILNRLAPGETLRGTALPKLMPDNETSEAWLYSNPDSRYCIGSSLMYRREAWERRPFNEHLSPAGRGEDHEFWRLLKSVGVSSIHSCDSANFPWRTQLEKHGEPRMICSIHAGNAQHYPSDVLETSQSWKRAPAWDNWCRKAMTL